MGNWQIFTIVILVLALIALIAYVIYKQITEKRQRPLTTNVALYAALKKISSDDFKETSPAEEGKPAEVNWKATCEIQKALAKATLEMVSAYEKEKEPAEQPKPEKPERAKERPNRKGGK